MSDRLSTLLRLTALCGVLALSACNRGKEQEKLAALGNDADPALTSALNDQILVDPNLANQSNRNAVRPPATPSQSQYPQGGAQASAGAGAAEGARTQLASGGSAGAGGGNGCTDPAKLNYNNGWAGKLPAHMPLYPGARVAEAAGNNQNGCSARIVTFATADDWQRVLDWYHTRAVKAGYSSEHQLRGKDHVLAGTSDRDGGAFYLIVTPAGSGAEVALISNKGA